MKSKKIIIYASLATLLLSGSKLTVEARTGADQISAIAKEIEAQDYETLTVENITLEEANEYVKQGYIMIARNETNAEFIRTKVYGKSNEIISDYVNNQENYEKLAVKSITTDEINQYLKLGYTLVGLNENSAELIRKQVNVLKK